MRARRVAALWLPGLPLQVVGRDDPAMHTQPVAVTDGTVILARNACAVTAGVTVGMRVAEAATHAPDLVLASYDARRTQALWDVVLDQLDALGPIVEDAGLGHALVDLSGVGRNERLLVRRTLQALSALLGLTARAALADGPFIASVAARRATQEITVIPRGEGAAFLAPLPPTLLPLPAQATADLARLGIRTIGRFASLRYAEIEQRYGKVGMVALSLAIGQDDRPLVPRVRERRAMLGHTFVPPVDDLAPVVFVAKALIDNHATILRREGLVAVGLDLTLGIEGAAPVTIPQRWSAPCVPGAAELDALRLALATRIAGEERDGAMPPRVTDLGVTLCGCTPDQGTQLPLFNAGIVRQRQEWAHLLTRLHALLGPMGVVEDVLVPDHRIEERWRSRPYDSARIGTPPSASALLDLPPLPALPGFVRRRPPDAITVAWVDERIMALSIDDSPQAVIAALGPYTIDGHWWTAQAYRRAYWVLATTDQTLHVVTEDETTGQWARIGLVD